MIEPLFYTPDVTPAICAASLQCHNYLFSSVRHIMDMMGRFRGNVPPAVRVDAQPGTLGIGIRSDRIYFRDAPSATVGLARKIQPVLCAGALLASYPAK